MPSIEIVCVDPGRPLQLDNLPFAVVSGTDLISHRLPSRFQSDFDRLKGCIYHLGNPRLKDPDASGAFFAWDLLSAECQGQREETFLHFADPYAGAIHLLMTKLLQASPARTLLFTSDHQFGPPIAARLPELGLEEFWRLHDSRRLRMNALYPIVGSSKER